VRLTVRVLHPPWCEVALRDPVPNQDSSRSQLFAELMGELEQGVGHTRSF
jgi:hypothetical protein